MKTKSFYGLILMLKAEETPLLPARAARAEKGSRSTKGRVAFPWPCCLIKRGIFRIPYSAPCGFHQVSAFCLWQELVLMPTFALTQIGVDTGSDSFPINLTPDTRNVCHEARLLSNCSPSHQCRSLLKKKKKKSVSLTHAASFAGITPWNAVIGSTASLQWHSGEGLRIWGFIAHPMPGNGILPESTSETCQLLAVLSLLES